MSRDRRVRKQDFAHPDKERQCRERPPDEAPNRNCHRIAGRRDENSSMATHRDACERQANPDATGKQRKHTTMSSAVISKSMSGSFALFVVKASSLVATTRLPCHSRTSSSRNATARMTVPSASGCGIPASRRYRWRYR